jgi:hypothetical protein
VRGEPSALQCGSCRPERAGEAAGSGEGHCAWCPSHPKDSTGSMEDTLEELLQHREPKALREYLRKVRTQGWARLEGNALTALLRKGVLTAGEGGPFLIAQCGLEGTGLEAPGPQRDSVFLSMKWEQSGRLVCAYCAPDPAAERSCCPPTYTRPSATPGTPWGSCYGC